MVLHPSVQSVKSSPYWLVVADESTDSATQEQLGLYVRYKIFFQMKRITGHPNAENLFASMKVIDNEDSNLKLPLVRQTTDGDSVMISERGGVFGKLKERVNPKLFSTHCPPHWLVFASQTGKTNFPMMLRRQFLTHSFSSKTIRGTDRTL